MIWLTWRQARTQVSVVLVAVAVLAAVMIATGPDLVHVYTADGSGFLNRVQAYRLGRVLYVVGLVASYAAPPLIGAFWGAPLIARELEAGTHRLVWNQSITRTRWLAVKLAFTSAAAVAATGLLALAVSWWSGPIDAAVADGAEDGFFSLPRLYPAIFGARGLVPVGYTLLALVLGVAVGLVVRRSVPAIAVTLAAVVAVQIAVPWIVRPHLAPSGRLVTTITAQNFKGVMVTGSGTGPLVEAQLRLDARSPGDWVLSDRTVDASGRTQDRLPSWITDCAPEDGPVVDSRSCFSRLGSLGYRQEVRFQPADRFWTLQWREAAVLSFVALLLAGFCFRRVRRDLS